MRQQPDVALALAAVFKDIPPWTPPLFYSWSHKEQTRTAVINRLFHAYARWKGEIARRRTGVLISNDEGESVAYAMWKLEDRGPMMIKPGCKVYRGMIVGEHTRDNDLEINVLKGKQLTNIRAAGKDAAVRLTPPIKMTLERASGAVEAAG